MKRLIFFCLAILLAYSSEAQINKNQNNIWLFGYSGAGINFNTPSGEPIGYQNPHKLGTSEGSASICNENGELLFYTDGSIVWDKNNNQMPNGDKLKGSFSSSNSALIIPNPKLKNIFYIFTAPGCEKINNFGVIDSSSGIYYSVVDMNLNNGNGDIINKNVLLYYPATEKLAAVKNLTNNTIWIITHEWKSNAFKSFLVNENGVSPNPVVSNIGTVHNGENVVATGRLSASPDGTKLVVTVPFIYGTWAPNGNLELYDFNPNTGVVSNPLLLDDKQATYSAAFSENGKVLYLRVIGAIWQYDLSKYNIDSIKNSKYIVSTGSYPFYNAIERGPNGKIYIINDQRNNLDAIDNPNLLGANCNYKKSVVSFNGRCDWGLPTFLQSYYNLTNDTNKIVPKVNITSPSKVCFGDSVYLKVRVNFADKFKCSIYRTFPKFEVLYDGNGTDSTANIVLAPFTDYNNYLKVVTIDSQNSIIRDSITFQIAGRFCCSDVVLNGSFNSIAAGNECFTVEYETDFDFRASKSNRCQDQFTALGQMNSQYAAEFGNPNFNSLSRNNNSHFIFGDPLINVPQRAWYQKNPTRIGTKYKFTAYVRNVEKTIRNNTTAGKSLNFWLGTKDNVSNDTIARIKNVEYNQNWLELTGIFTAKENETELSIGVLGTSADNLSSYGFGIDDITLIPLPDYDLAILNNDTILCELDSILLESKINTPVNVRWTPTTGLTNPNSLNTFAKPTTPTKYKLEVIDKYGCKFIDSIFVDLKSCKVNCKPNISISLSDTTIEVGDKFCINGTLLAQCDSLELPDTLKVTIKIPSKLFKVISASESYETQKENEFTTLVLKFSKNKLILNQDYKFEICINSLLSDTLKGDFAAEEDTSKYILMLNDSSKINLQLCGEKIRLVNFFLITNFEASVSEDKIKIFLTTEEQGEFKFTLINMNGSQVAKLDYKTTKSTYNKELIEELDISQLSSGTYTLRMRKPDGKFRNRTIVIVK